MASIKVGKLEIEYGGEITRKDVLFTGSGSSTVIGAFVFRPVCSSFVLLLYESTVDGAKEMASRLALLNDLPV